MDYMALHEDIKKIFSKFGNLMIPISIISFIGLIWIILYWFTAQNRVIIFTIGVIIGISSSIFFVLVFIEIYRAAKLLKNKLLKNFIPQFIVGTILKTIGDIIILIAISSFFGHSLFSSLRISFSFLTIIIAILLIIGGSILRSYAWRSLREFFETNYEYFPLDFGDFGRSSAKNCKSAAKVDVLILPIFGIFANLLRLVGYLKFIRLRNLKNFSNHPKMESDLPISTIRATATKNFCTNCGSAITPGTRFCQQCGIQIK